MSHIITADMSGHSGLTSIRLWWFVASINSFFLINLIKTFLSILIDDAEKILYLSSSDLNSSVKKNFKAVTSTCRPGLINDPSVIVSEIFSAKINKGVKLSYAYISVASIQILECGCPSSPFHRRKRCHTKPCCRFLNHFLVLLGVETVKLTQFSK